MPVDHLICNHFSRKVVLEKWFFKLRFFFWSTTFLQPENLRIYSIKPPFFWSTTFLEPDFSNQISRTTFLGPLFNNFLEKWLQNKWFPAFRLTMTGFQKYCQKICYIFSSLHRVECLLYSLDQPNSTNV